MYMGMIPPCSPFSVSAACAPYVHGGILIIRKSHSGRDVSSIRSDEGEILFPRGTRFKVVKYYQDENGKNIIDVEEVE